MVSFQFYTKSAIATVLNPLRRYHAHRLIHSLCKLNPMLSAPLQYVRYVPVNSNPLLNEPKKSQFCRIYYPTPSTPLFSEISPESYNCVSMYGQAVNLKQAPTWAPCVHAREATSQTDVFPQRLGISGYLYTKRQSGSGPSSHGSR